MSLEDVVTYINEDEMIDVSPLRIRMRYVACPPFTLNLSTDLCHLHEQQA